MVLFATFFTSLSSILIRFSQAPSLVISSYRMLFTVSMIFLPVVVKSRQKFKSVRRKDIILCCLSGVFLALHFASWIASIHMTSIANSTILVSCSPIFVAVANYFILKERLNKKMLLGIILSILGTTIIAMGTDDMTKNSEILGNLLAFMGAIFVAGYLVTGGIVRKSLDAGTYVLIVYSAATTVLFIMCLITSTPIYPYQPKEFLIFFALAFFCSILGHTVYNYLMKYVSATLISVSTLCEPIFASTLAVILFKEMPPMHTIIGGIFVLLGVYSYITAKK
jgi:drug/metabolite transporter (DMT)-like permease